jgi:peptidoglycan/LPS O-acetylase OafA/YrhL
MIRGVAALAVVAYHIRYKFFIDYADVGARTMFTSAFYALTSFGHDAVMVFFVLSGYLITGTILRDVGRRQWAWPRYLLNRFSRLYVVLIPGLIATVFWDSLGIHLFPAHPAYTGATQPWMHDFFPVQPALTAAAFIGNVTFLQRIMGTPSLGSNNPLWSLTYELAYYLVFPAALLALSTTRRWRDRIACGLASVVLAFVFGRAVLLYFPIWLFGLGLHHAPRLNPITRTPPLLRNAGAAFIVLLGVSFRHTAQFQSLTGGSVSMGDYFVGAVFAVALFVFLHDVRPASEGLYALAASGTSHISYTLYVVHMPLLLFLRALLLPGRGWTPGLLPTLYAACIASLVLVYATGMWYLFESKTGEVRAFLANGGEAARAWLLPRRAN